MKIFDGLRAWFSASVPLAHINTWIADGGIHIRDPQRSSVQYFFSNVRDQQTAELVQSSHVVYKSAWITDSSLSRTRQPLGAYALDTSPGLNAAVRNDSPQLSKRPRSVISERRASFTPSKKHSSGIPRPSSNNRATIAEYSINDYMGGEAGGVHWDETQSIKSRCSSRHSNTSSIVSYSRRQQQVVSRFVICADKSTQASILADVQDFTPNGNGFVAYKIPKMPKVYE